MNPHREPTWTSISDYLATDHDRLDALLADACALMGDDRSLEAVDLFDAFRQGLLRHIALEEEVIFPAFDEHVRMVGPTEVMRMEHRQIEALLAPARAAAAAADLRAFFDAADEIAARLKAHNLKEERVIYPRVDAALEHGERAQVLSDIVSR